MMFSSKKTAGDDTMKGHKSSESTNFWEREHKKTWQEVANFTKKHPGVKDTGDVDFLIRKGQGHRTFDLLVLGAGSGGIAAARRAAAHGADVAIIEKSVLGGTCVNLGCIPKKVMYNFAGVNEVMTKHYKHYAQTLQNGATSSFSWESMKAARDAYVKRLDDIYEVSLEKEKIRVIKGHARFLSRNVVQVDGGDYFKAEKIIIATGGRPTVPQIPGAELGYTSDDFFNKITSLPKKVGIAGAGYIAIEIASVLRSLGSDVTLFIRHDEFLRSFDSMLRRQLRNEFDRVGIKVATQMTAKELQWDQSDSTITYVSEKNQHFEEFDKFIWAVGRTPNTQDMNLDKAFIELTPTGSYIKTNEFSETSSPNVFAVGDICGKVELTPYAIKEGRNLAERLFGGVIGKVKDGVPPVDTQQIPTVVFSHPPIGTVGLTEDEAVNKLGKDKVGVYTSSFTDLYYQMMPEEERVPTTMKIIVDLQDQKRVLGMHVIGKNADEIIQGYAVGVRMGCTLQDLQNTLAIHPTASEEFILMTESGKQVLKQEMDEKDARDSKGC